MNSGIMSPQVIEQWLSGSDNTVPPPPPVNVPNPPPAASTTPPTNPTAADNPPTGEPAPAVNKDDIEKFIAEGVQQDNPQGGDTPKFFKDYTELYTQLLDKKIAQPLEENYIPKTEEEFWDALGQSSEYNAQAKVEERWQEYLQALPESVRRVQQYAHQGAVNAQDLGRYINSLSQSEIIATLDPAKPEDQERIVLLHLLNTGMNEQEARDEIKDLNEMKKLESFAKRSHPALKKTYDEQVLRLETEQKQLLEQRQLFVRDIGTNTAYFLQNDQQDFLPFKVTSDTMKKTIWDLAATVVSVTDNDEPIFAWEQHMHNLMMGDEKKYQKFMKIITFMADDEGYDNNVSKNASSDTNKKNFKKIAVGGGNALNHNPQEPATQPIKIQTPTPPVSNARWTGR